MHCPSMNMAYFTSRIMKQLLLFRRSPSKRKAATTHGGTLARGKRKVARPFDARRPHHFVLRSSRARGSWSLRRPANHAAIEGLLRRLSNRHEVRVYQRAIVENHIHLLLRARDRRALASFMRAFAGLVACKVTGARRGNPCGKFWDWICFSRMVAWGRDFAGVRAYVVMNEREATGEVPARASSRHPRSVAPS